MGSLTVVIRRGVDGRISPVCRDSLVNFTLELERIIEMPDDTRFGVVWTQTPRLWRSLTRPLRCVRGGSNV